jgi:D-glycero-D-manno-heptose 1,7-bisphosphate phosphatase
MELKKQKILFLDRDGTICYDDGAFGSEKFSYKEVIEKTRPLEGVKDSLKLAKEKGYMLVVISNQAGIAKGRFDECDTHYSNKLLQEKLGGIIDGFYYCPHHTSGKNNKGVIAENAKRDLIFHCDCRKPEIGMFIQCENDLKNGKLQYIDENLIANKTSYEYDRNKIYRRDVDAAIVDKENSYMIGDKWLDVLAGERYGVNPIFVMSGEGFVEYNHKKDKQKELPKKFEIYDDINKFIKERL